MKYLLIAILICNTCLADDGAVVVSKGDAAPFSGVLLSNEKANQLKVISIEHDEYKLLNDSLNRSINLYKSNEAVYDNKVNVLLQQNDKLAVDLYSARQTTMWEKLGFFVLGVAATTAAVYGVKKATQ